VTLMNVVPFSPLPARASRDASLIVVFADFQREHVTPSRAFAVRDSDACLTRSLRWLELARTMMLPVAHFRQYRSGSYFNRASLFSDWIDGFRPRTDETLYERSRASCYADSGFSDFTTHVADPLLILCGLTGDQVCLATAVEASSRGHRAIFLSDCSATPSLGGLSEADSHSALCHIIGGYADVLTLDQLLEQMTAAPVSRFA
jgi:nicotinamidase-related amidase